VIAATRLAPRTALTRKPLPDRDADPSIAALSTAERATAVAVWFGRAASERRASGAFAYLAGELARAGSPAELVALARRAVADELRHAEICRRVATAFAGAELPAAPILPVTAPAYADASPELRRVLHVIGMCCANETTGSAFLELCGVRARGQLVNCALHELLADEIDHARIGWAFLASPAVSASMRAQVAAWLPRLLDDNLAAWRDRPRREITDALVAQGCPRWDEVDATVIAAIADLLLPGFEHAGINTAAARTWLQACTRAEPRVSATAW
jgi:hypothetical protein